MKEAIVLAGGFGTRLRSVVPDLPKPMAPIAGRPFLEILLTRLAVKGFNRIVLSLGFMAESIVQHFGSSYEGMEIDYVIEDIPLGTGGAIRAALSHCRSDAVCVLNGDTYLNIEADALWQVWERYREPIIVARHVEDTSRFGRLHVESDRVRKFSEKGIVGPGLINAGCYVVPRNLLDNFPIGQNFSFEAQFLEGAVKESNIMVFVSEGQFIDIGVPEDFARAQTELAGGGRLSEISLSRPALFLDRDGVINVDHAYVCECEDFDFIDGIFDLCRNASQAGYLIFVVTNQAGIGRGYYNEEKFQALTTWMCEQFSLRDVNISKVYFCPTHPVHGIGKYKTESYFRKPQPGMILQAAQEFKVDLAKSVLIGDKESDLLAGDAAGVGTLVSFRTPLEDFNNIELRGRAKFITEFSDAQYLFSSASIKN